MIELEASNNYSMGKLIEENILFDFDDEVIEDEDEETSSNPSSLPTYSSRKR